MRINARRVKIALPVAAIVLIGAAGVVAKVAVASSSATFYWWTPTAEQRLEHSDWADARGVANVNCSGVGAYRKGTVGYEFATFRCDLQNSDYQRIGHVTLKTTGPESFKTVGFVARRCPA